MQLHNHIKYGATALLFAALLIAVLSLTRCSDGEELIPTGNCTPENCEFKAPNTRTEKS